MAPRPAARPAKPARLDAELVRRGLAGSRAEARAAIERGIVSVGGIQVDRPASQVSPNDAISLLEPASTFVSRGGDKLHGALERLATIRVAGRAWLDLGSSTGGFTDVLLQKGAARVIAVDVGYGQLDWRLRNDPRVVVMERTNARALTAEALPYVPDAAVADLSFVSLRLVLPPLVSVVATDADLLLLVKPQFEVGKANVGKGGVVRDPSLWKTAVGGVVERARELGWGLHAVVPAHPPGPAGNREFFVHLRRHPCGGVELIDAAIDEVAP